MNRSSKEWQTMAGSDLAALPLLERTSVINELLEDVGHQSGKIEQLNNTVKDLGERNEMLDGWLGEISAIPPEDYDGGDGNIVGSVKEYVSSIEQSHGQLKVLARELCDAVENEEGLTETRYALRCGRLVTQVRNALREKGL